MAPTAASAYDVLIREELQHQYARKDSLEHRGFSVISSAGAIVTALFALAAFAREQAGFRLAPVPRVLFVVAAAALVMAAALGVWVNRPTKWQQSSVEWLEKLVQPEYWNAPAEVGSRRAAESVVNRIRVAQLRNQGKSRVLQLAVAAEALGIVAVGATIIAMISKL